MKLFISYHLADQSKVRKIKSKLDEKDIKYYSVPENQDFTGWHNEEISKFILSKMKGCQILMCVVGKETYTRPHVDYEIHEALKGGVSKRLGIIAVLLEDRGDTVNNIDFSTFPPRLKDNINYLVLQQNASLMDNIEKSINKANENRNNSDIKVNNTRKCMKLPNKYYS